MGNKRNTEILFNNTKKYLSMKILVIPEGLIDEELFFLKNVFSFAKKNKKLIIEFDYIHYQILKKF